MKQPLQALLIAGEAMGRGTILGHKTISIREGHRGYRAGEPLILCCEKIGWSAMADVTSVRHCALKEVSENELLDDGFPNHAVALETLQRFYPNMSMDSDVTIIRWNNVRGRCVEARTLFPSIDQTLAPVGS